MRHVECGNHPTHTFVWPATFQRWYIRRNHRQDKGWFLQFEWTRLEKCIKRSKDVAKEDALNQLRANFINLEGKLEAMQEAADAPVSYDLPEHTHPPPDLAHEHTEYALMNHTHAFEVGEHTHPELSRVVLSSEVQSILESEVKRVFEIELEGHIDLLH